MRVKSYSELIRLPTIEERYEYLRDAKHVGDITFGYDRYLNQALYHSEEWRRFRYKIVVRDDGNDLAMPGYPVGSRGIIHHIIAITPEDIVNRAPCVFDPENVILCTHQTHNAIHYGNPDLLPKLPVERRPNDTCPWKL